MKWEKKEEIEDGKAALWTVTVQGADGSQGGTDRVLAFTKDKENGALAGRVRVEFWSVGESSLWPRHGKRASNERIEGCRQT